MCCRQLHLHGARDQGELTWFHCHGRTHVYALCRALLVNKLVCFHRTKANCHRFLRRGKVVRLISHEPNTFATALLRR